MRVAVWGVTAVGPKWSRKHQAPMVRCVRRGRARRTGAPPTVAVRLEVTSIVGSTDPSLPAGRPRTGRRR